MVGGGGVCVKSGLWGDGACWEMGAAYGGLVHVGLGLDFEDL